MNHCIFGSLYPASRFNTSTHIKWYQFVSSAEMWCIAGQPLLTATVQAWKLSVFGHIARLDDNIDAKKILTAFPPEDWKRLPGRPRITWMKTVLNDLESHNLTLTEAVNMAQNRPLWTLEVAGCEWHCALLVMQARNDGDSHINVHSEPS